MNPIFSQMAQPKLNSFSGIKDPRSYVLNAVGKMSPEQKAKFKSLIPMAQNIAGKQGINLNNALSELQSRM